MGRFKDAYRTFVGPRPRDAEVARMRTEWAGLMMEIGNVMDQLTAQIGRVTKRDARAAAKKMAPDQPTEIQPPTMSRQDRKRANRLRRMGVTAPVAAPPTNGDEPQ